MAVISIAMPAYNAEKYISYAIESVIKQTFEDWELIIVDDASTDSTPNIIEEYAKRDSRIRVYTEKENSGSARLPRLKAISMMDSKWVTYLDADDYLEPEYLKKMLSIANREKADIVLSKMVIISDEGKTAYTIPKEGYDTTQVLSGKEACSRTIGEWQIGGNGLTSLLLYRKAVTDCNSKLINSDEIDTRKLFYCANRVALSDVRYYYRHNAESITKHLSVKTLGNMDTAEELLLFVKNEFGKDSLEYKKQANVFIGTLRVCTIDFYRLYFKIKHDQKIEIIDNIKRKFSHVLNLRDIADANSLTKFLFMTHYHLFMFSCLLMRLKSFFNVKSI
jgi:glycosyltransferase involved in cell wall biosynthesis